MKSILTRFPNNPLFSPSDLIPSRPDLEIMCVFNPAAIMFKGKRLLMVRVAEKALSAPGFVATPIFDPSSGTVAIKHFRLDDPDVEMSDPRAFTFKNEIYLTSLSHFRVATSEDGIHFTIDTKPTMFPQGPYEAFGIEDARITKIEEDFYVNYTAASNLGIVTALAKTSDFINFERLGIIFGPDNKDVALFPEKIAGRYYAFHRPAVRHAGQLSIWAASSDNLTDWGGHQIVIEPRAHSWDCGRVGTGASPIKTSQGWLSLYHAGDQNSRYCLGALLLDLDQPWKVIARSEEPFFVPEAIYETKGFMPDVVFHNGTVDLGNGQLELYYGGGDLVTCGARVTVADLFTHLGV